MDVQRLSRRTVLVIACIAPWSRLRASPNFLDEKDPAQWSATEIKKLTTDSPWAKKIRGYYLPSGRQSAPWSERPWPGNYRASELYGTALWESAQPIRNALKHSLPTAFDNHYVISVNGLPAPSQEELEDLKQFTTMEKMPGGINHAALVNRREGPNPTVLFGFPKSSLALPTAGQVEFSGVEFTARLDPLIVKARFNIKRMLYRRAVAL